MPGQRSGREALPRAVSDRENRKRVLVYDRNWGVLVTNVDEIVCGCWNGGEYQSCKGSGQPRPGGLQGSQAYPADDLSRRAQPLRLPAAPVPGNPAGVAIDGDPRRATGVSNSGRGPSPATGLGRGFDDLLAAKTDRRVHREADDVVLLETTVATSSGVLVMSADLSIRV